ncbi:MAG: iron complex transport system ATP-binding protein [Spirochaetes bacterium]|nr:MAG: iron complex transport system ATP-binding protein [Spirochaetota bacterium]
MIFAPPATTLEAQNLGFSRRNTGPILENISFTAERGKKIALLGANGCGKTTLLSLLGGRLSPAQGKVLIHGSPLAALSLRATAGEIAFLPQIERLPFNYKVLDFVLLGRAPHVGAFSLPGPRDREKALEALEELELTDIAQRGAGELSGGEFQLVRLARCLSQEARILLLDEPTSLLDPANAARIGEVISNLADRGKTILFATHDVALSQFVADEAILLADRRILARGPVGRILEADLLDEAFGVKFGLASIPIAFGTRLAR